LPERPTQMRPLIRSHLRSMLRTGFGRLRETDDVLMDSTAHPGNTGGRAYVLTNGPRSFHLRFRPRRWRMWRMMVRAAAMGWTFRKRRGAAGAQWAHDIAAYRDPAWWSALFATATRVPPPARPADAPAEPTRKQVA
jgi:hypothetical protein